MIPPSIAAKEGNLERLKWLMNKDYPWNDSIIDLAAINGHLHILKWIKEYNDSLHYWPYNSTDLVITNSVKYGNIELLVFLFHHGFLVNYLPCVSEAIKHGHHHVVKWLNKNFALY